MLKKKTLVIVGFSLTLLVVLLLALSSPIAKHLIEKYDVQFTGREITTSSVYLNPFTGYIRLNNLVIYEQESDIIFIEAKSLRVNFAMLKLFSKTYEISSVTLENPLINIIQKGKVFNFSDVVEFYSDTTKVKDTLAEPTKFNILKMKVINGEFHYDDIVTPVTYFVKNVNLSSPGLWHDVDSLPIKFDFSTGIGSGDFSGEFTANFNNLNYSMAVKIDSFDMNPINQYLKDLMNFGTFSAFLNADMRSTGNFGTVDSMSSSGRIQISEFHFGKNVNEDFASFDKLIIAINELSPKKMIYHYDSVSLTKPMLKYEIYDYLDNIQAMFGEGGENVTSVQTDPNRFNLVIEIAGLIKQISENFLASQYKVGRLAIYEGDIQFNDYALENKFAVALQPLTVIADSIDKSRDRVSVTVSAQVQPYGNLQVDLSVNPLDSSYFDLTYNFEKLPLPMFNPYLTTYTSYPLDKGTLEFHGVWKVRDGKIDSDNHVVILDPRVAKRTINRGNNWLPLPLAVSFVRERANVVDYQIPIKGDLNDPKFKLNDVIFSLLENIFLKPVTIPYRMEVRNVEKEIEKSLFIKWPHLESELTRAQTQFIDRMVKFLKDNPDAVLKITPNFYDKKERELALLFLAKKQFFMMKSGIKTSEISDKDIDQISKISIKDPDFMAYMRKEVSDSLLFTAQDRAKVLIDQKVLNQYLVDLKKNRINLFLEEFKDAEVSNRVKVAESKAVIPFNGFSFFDISYQGDVPEYLIEAFNKMNELDSENPRSKYQSKRKELPKS